MRLVPDLDQSRILLGIQGSIEQSRTSTRTQGFIVTGVPIAPYSSITSHFGAQLVSAFMSGWKRAWDYPKLPWLRSMVVEFSEALSIRYIARSVG